MTLLEWGALGELIGGVAIIVSFIYVGVQVKQNTNILKTQMLNEESQRAVRNDQMLIGNNGADAWAKALSTPKELTLAEQRVIEGYLYRAQEQWRYTYTLGTTGLVEEEWKTRIEQEVPYFLANPYGRAWWSIYSNSEITSLIPAEFRNFIDEVLAKQPLNFTADYHAEVMHKLQEAR